MQKVIQRTERAQRVAARKLQRSKDHQAKGESWERFQARNRMVRATGDRIRQAKINRQVDWEAGSLAPRRDVGENATRYGAITMYDLHGPDRDPKKRPWFHVAEGDRVVVTRGRDKGRIGVVNDTSKERATVTVKDVNVVDVHIPKWMNQDEGSFQEIQAVPKAIPVEDVKLVYPLPDPETGIPRDVIIDRLMFVNRHYDKNTKEWDEGDRVIPGTNTIIPWPERAEQQFEDYDDDTLRITVEEQTFRPFLLHPPMPLSVIDELRNKYSKFRTRHDWEYLEKKELEDSKTEKRKELVKGMRTPLQELAELRKQQKAVQEKALTDEQLAKIGAVIAQQQAKVVDAVQQQAGQ